MTKKFDYLVFIGRFQPAHNAHIEIIENALELSDHIIILIGSSYQPRTPKNPFTSEEREELIKSAFGEDLLKRFNFRYVSDKIYNDQQWAIDIQGHVQDIIEEKEWEVEPTIGIIGHKKDNSTFYLDMFPQWELVEFPNVQDLHATTIRDYYFNEKWKDTSHIPHSEDIFTEMCKDHLNEGIFDFLIEWRKNDIYKNISAEHTFYENYDGRKYEIIYTTVDGVVIQSGHILLVRRRAYPGKGLWAIPGGFLKPDEAIVDSVIRELREETKLKVPVPVLKGSIKDSHVFDHPERSLRGRTVTHAYLIVLNPGPLPKVKGADDADKAKWFPLEEVLTMESQLFEDHYSIINYFVGRV